MKVRGIVCICAVVLMVASLGSASVTAEKAGMSVKTPGIDGTRALGALTGSLVVTDLGSLQANVDITIGHTGTATTALDLVWVYGQLYDYPWAGGLPTWSPPGSNTFVEGSVQLHNPATAGNPFTASYSFTVPLQQQYQGWGLAYGGVSWTGTTYTFSVVTQYIVFSGTTANYVQSITQATATPDPNAGGTPVPMLSMPALFILGMIMAGVGVLLLRRS